MQGSVWSGRLGEGAARAFDPVAGVLHDPSFAARYEVIEAIGSGSFSAVYRARQRATGQEVAVKVLYPPRAADGRVDTIGLQRFRREAQVCAAFHHPNIVRLIDAAGFDHPPFFVVFEFVPGWNLADLLAAQGALGLHDATHLMIQVLDALSCAHAGGVIHRDLKPANIMISSTGARRNAYVLDFGLASITAETQAASPRLTLRGEFLGTAAYCAPEQLVGGAATPGSDLYSWGLIFLECLTGVHALEGRSVQEVVHKQLSPDPIPVPADLPPDIREILVAVTQKDATRRPSSSLEVLRALQAPPLRPPTFQTPPPPAESRPSPAKRSQTPAAPWRLPSRNPSFTGRGRELRQIKDCFASARPPVIVALHGLGGVGKTQLAIQWVHRHAASYQVTAWLRAEDPDTLAGDFADLASALRLPESKNPDQRDRIEAVRAWLQDERDWLLVFDNATSPEAIRPYLPRGAAGHVLVTSRNQAWRGLATTVAVEALPHGEAIEFLLCRTGEHDERTASILTAELGRLPLALEEAAAYMDATGRSMASYLELFRNHQRALLSESNPPPDYPTTLLGAWEISFRRLDEEEPNAVALLKLSAFLGPDDIPLKLLRADPGSLPERLRHVVVDEIAFDRAIAALRRYSLVKVASDSLSVHRLVQLVTRERLLPDEKDTYARLALQLVETAFPRNGMEGDIHPDSAGLLPHARAALSHRGTDGESSIRAARLLGRTATYLSARGLALEARDSMAEYQRILGSMPSEREADLAENCVHYGMVLYALGEAPTALAQFQRALELHERDRNVDERIAGDHLNLAFVLRTLGDFAAAGEHGARCLGVLDRSGATARDARILAYGILARIAFSQGDVRSAKRHVGALLALLEKHDVASFRPLISGALNHAAWVVHELGDLAAAERCIDLSLRVGSHAFGKDHPIVAVSHAIRGSLHQTRGEHERAGDEFARALDGGERTCTRLHDDIAVARPRWARVVAKGGDLARARSLLTHTLTSLERICGDVALVESETRIALGTLLRREHQLADAEAEGARGLACLEARFGSTHPLRLHGLVELGWTHVERGEDDAARASFAEALALGDGAYGRQHVGVARSLEGLGWLEIRAGRRDRARQLLSDAVGIAGGCLGSAHEDVATIRTRLETA